LQSIFLILAVGFATASPNSTNSHAVVANLLDGTSVEGELSAWSEDELAIVRDGKEVRLRTDELVSMRWSRPTPSAARNEQKNGFVELSDGTVLPIREFQVAKSTAALALGAAVPEDQKTIQLPVRQVTGVRLRVLESAVQEQWDELRAQDLTSDVLAVVERDGKNLDYYEGILGDITPKKIEFEIEGESNRVDRSDVAGWIYYRKNQSSQSEARCILHGGTGLRASAAKLRLSDQTVHITTASGVELAWPLADLQFADFSAGKIVYLSDVEPASQRWTPVVGLPAAAESAAKYGQLRFDQSAFGGPLTLRLAGSGHSSSDLKSFSKGLAIRSRTELVYRLPNGFTQFVALAGIDPAASATGAVRLIIQADDQLLFEADITGDQPRREIKLDVTDVKRLKIIVDFGQNLDIGDWLNLCDARLIK
jgi:NPCBM/NEW2 domain